MALSDRNAPAPAPQDEDDILERTPSHPVTTVLLIVNAIALLIAIGLAGSELGRYVNQTTRKQLGEYKVTAVQYCDEKFDQISGTQPEESR